MFRSFNCLLVHGEIFSDNASFAVRVCFAVQVIIKSCCQLVDVLQWPGKKLLHLIQSHSSSSFHLIWLFGQIFIFGSCVAPFKSFGTSFSWRLTYVSFSYHRIDGQPVLHGVQDGFRSSHLWSLNTFGDGRLVCDVFF